MTYEEIIEKVRETYANVNLDEVKEHIAIQINVYGEGGGIFYLEMGEGYLNIEPYDYFDNDASMTVPSNILLEVLDGEKTFDDAMNSGYTIIVGNEQKFNFARQILEARNYVEQKDSKDGVTNS